MTDKLIVALIGVFIIIMSLVCIIKPEVGFNFNHPMKKQQPTEHGLRMTVFSGIVGLIFGLIVVVASFMYL